MSEDLSFGSRREGGGVVVSGAVVVWHKSTFSRAWDATPRHEVMETIPDHPALPAVAQWLSETPGAVESLQRMARVHSGLLRERGSTLFDDQLRYLRAAEQLIDALAGEGAK